MARATAPRSGVGMAFIMRPTRPRRHVLISWASAKSIRTWARAAHRLSSPLVGYRQYFIVSRLVTYVSFHVKPACPDERLPAHAHNNTHGLYLHRTRTGT